VQGARAAYQRAIDSGHPDVAPRAARNLGLLLQAQGDVQGAREAYQRAIDSGHADEAPRAARSLRTLSANERTRTARKRQRESLDLSSTCVAALRVPEITEPDAAIRHHSGHARPLPAPASE
jgi:Flp pilus assembly protein TadD